MKRLLPFLFLACALAGARFVASQPSSLAAWAPADVEAFVAFTMDDPAATLRNLNIAAFVGSYLQPPRAPFESAQPFDRYLPLDILDLEVAPFASLVLPWLDDSLAVAYQTLDLTAGAQTSDALLILSTRDSFAAANALSSAVEGQDNLRAEELDGAALFTGDLGAIAITPSIVLIGPETLVRAALDAGTGAAPSLAEAPDFAEVSAALPAAPEAFVFLRDGAAGTALPALLSLQGESGPLLAAFGAALSQQSSADLPVSALFESRAEAIGAALDLDPGLTRKVTADIAVLLPETGAPAGPAFDPDLLPFVPRSAMLVYSTPEAGAFADAALTALPFAAAGPALLSALPLQGPLPAGVVPLPDPEQAAYVTEALLAVLAESGVDYGAARAGLTGSALLALLPRPNNPLPVTGALSDVLLVAGHEDAAALARTLSDALSAYTVSVDAAPTPGGDVLYQVAVPESTELLAQFGAVGGLFVFGTGGSLDDALRARSGDNRLIDQPRWERAGAPAPGLYLDIDRLYNTYLPVSGGSSAGPVNLVGITGATPGSDLITLSAEIAVTLGN